MISIHTESRSSRSMYYDGTIIAEYFQGSTRTSALSRDTYTRLKSDNIPTETHEGCLFVSSDFARQQLSTNHYGFLYE